MRKELEEEEKEDSEARKLMTEACHTHPYYLKVIEQEKSDSPPAFRYIYFAEDDDWEVEESSPEDILQSMFRKVNRRVEKKALQARIQMICSIRRAFQETRYREEVARKGYGRMRRRVIQKAKERMEEWEEERTRQGRPTIKAIKGSIASMKAIDRPGPSEACHGCGIVPDHRLKRCSRCRTTWYCNTRCQQKD